MKKTVLLLLLQLLLSGCVSFDIVRSETTYTGDPTKKHGPGEIIETRGGLWSGVVINVLVPLPPLVLRHGDETTTVWKENGEVVYTETVNSRANGGSCLFLILRCGESSEIGSWGDFLFNDSGMYH